MLAGLSALSETRNVSKISTVKPTTIEMTQALAIVAAIIRRDDKILITKRPDNVHLAGLWEFPGGKVEAGESLEAALEREIREELGVDIAVVREFFSVEHDYADKSVHLHFFDCTILRGEPQLLDVADMRWVRTAELMDFEFPPADVELIRRLRSGG
jgi:8-oxo-dGTP diphosphatase